MTFEFITATAADGVLTVTLNRPDVLNSFTLRDGEGSCRARWRMPRTTPSVRAVLITGAGRGFCAGQDLSEVLPKDDGPMPDIAEIVRASYNPIIQAIRTLEKPVVCAVNGVAAGAGANLAFACDLTIAAEEASFVESFSKLGLIPDTSGTFFVPRLVGTQRATGMFFLAEKISGGAREGVGPDLGRGAAWRRSWRRRARWPLSLAAQATRGFGLTKRAMNASFTNTLDEQLDVEARGDAAKRAGRPTTRKAFARFSRSGSRCIAARERAAMSGPRDGRSASSVPARWARASRRSPRRTAIAVVLADAQPASIANARAGARQGAGARRREGAADARTRPTMRSRAFAMSSGPRERRPRGFARAQAS